MCTNAYRLTKWLRTVGEELEDGELLCNVASDNIAGEGYNVGVWAGDVTLEVSLFILSVGKKEMGKRRLPM